MDRIKNECIMLDVMETKSKKKDAKVETSRQKTKKGDLWMH